MADILQHLLILPTDSFFRRPPPIEPPAAEEDNMNNSSGTRLPNHQKMPGGFPSSGQPDHMDMDFVDADEFLQGIPINPKPGDLTPIQIGQTHSSRHSVAFHKLAQEKRITPSFEFPEVAKQSFSAKLILGRGVEVVDAGPHPSKKAAKEAVCEKGIEALKIMEAAPFSSSAAAAGKAKGQPEKNWVGLLQQLYQLEPDTTPLPLYIDFAVGSEFSCELVIDKRDTIPFGRRTLAFPNKKAAKVNAAREAVEWLIQNKYLPPDGQVAKGKKGRNSGSFSPAPGSTVVLNRDSTYAQKVNELCPQLGLTCPEYRLMPDPQAVSMYSGGAYFKDPILPRGPVGEVRNVFGKKNAKEECAKQVLDHLHTWAKGRNLSFRIAEKEDE